MFKNFVYKNHTELKDCALAQPNKSRSVIIRCQLMHGGGLPLINFLVK
jgi:hypothetical protein